MWLKDLHVKFVPNIFVCFDRLIDSWSVYPSRRVAFNDCHKKPKVRVLFKIFCRQYCLFDYLIFFKDTINYGMILRFKDSDYKISYSLMINVIVGTGNRLSDQVLK